MLSYKPIGRTDTECNYYANLGEAENHDYLSEDGNRPGRWWGEGSAKLGLTGQVEPEQFKNTLEGFSPDGSKRLVQERNGKVSNRAGFDLTFSVPKSLSCLWSQADRKTREELDRRAERALYRTLETFQEMCGMTRRAKDGRIVERGGMVAAVFRHDTARGLPGEVPDANLHFHTVLANVVVREDGTTGAFDARRMFAKRCKMWLGAAYRCELSRELEAMGIRTHRPKRERRSELASWFELDCIAEEFRKSMSKRRIEIEAFLRKHGLSGAKASEKAALLTREGKGQFSGEELFEAWAKLGREHNFTMADVKRVLNDAKPQEFDRAKGKDRSRWSGSKGDHGISGSL